MKGIILNNEKLAIGVSESSKVSALSNKFTCK